jgi:hypothetical protein
MRYHLRRTDKEIKEKNILEKILKETQYITLAMVKDGEPYLVSLSHGYDIKNQCIYFHCAREGKKLHYLRSNPKVWGQAIIDRGYKTRECTHEYATVMFQGEAKFLEKLEEKKNAFKTMINQLEEDPQPLLNKFLNSEEIKNTIVGKIEIEYMTGKKTPEISI